MADFNATFLDSPSIYQATQSPVDATYLSPSTVTVAANIRYYQRVLSSGLSAWCYYSTLNALDPSPLSTATSPNWTGSISDPQVVAAVIEP